MWELRRGVERLPFFSEIEKAEIETYVEVKFSLPKLSKWAKELSLIFGYYRFYDNLPPRIPQSIVDEYSRAQKRIQKTIATDTHESFLFSLAMKF